MESLEGPLSLLRDYFPILMFLAVAVALSCVMILVGFLRGPHRPDSEKVSAYECGFEPFSDARLPFFLSSLILKLRFSFRGPSV